MSDIIFGKNFKTFRKEKGLTQKQIANILGITNGYISDIEKGKANPSESLLRNIESKFRLNRFWLQTGEGEKFLLASECASIYKEGDDPELVELLKMTREILKSETNYAASLAANIKSFHRSVLMEREISDLKGRVGKIEEKLSTPTDPDGSKKFEAM